jgi:hypothetical protein
LTTWCPVNHRFNHALPLAEAWLNADADGNVSEIFWTYDAVGRLTDEAITHFDNSISQSEKFTYDLTGNRTKLERDHDGVAGIDEAITYNYDVNDRLITELFDDKTTANADTTTTYGYDHTQQTEKIITRSVSEVISSAKHQDILETLYEFST